MDRPSPAPHHTPAESPAPGYPPASVVVASCRHSDLLRACVASILPQCDATGAELVVARAAGSPGPAPDLPDRVKLVQAPAGSSVPELRGVGLAAAGHATVVLTEDHCIAGKAWLSTLLLRLSNNLDVVGGGMGNQRTKRAVDWAAFFAEYGFFSGTRPADEGVFPLITGANVGYADSVSVRVGEWARRGTWENVIHERLRAEGARFGFVPEAWVFQNQEYRLAAFCRDRFEHGRDFARDRLSERPGGPRWLWLLGTPVLPFLLLARVGVAAAGLAPAAFLRALPWTWVFLAAWSFGEAVGYWGGPWPDRGESNE